LKKLTIIIFYILIILYGLALIKLSIPTGNALVVKYYEEYTVQDGDTLTSITQKYPHGNNINKFIYIIKDTNNTTASIQSGQVLLIPIIEQR
jgi:LysM repeat protein